MDTDKKQKLNKILTGAVAALFWLIIWQGLAMLINKPFVLPTPLETVKALAALAVTGEFWTSVLVTFIRVLAGLAASFSFGLLAAMAAYKFPAVRVCLSGITAVFKATPVMSVIMFCILFLVSGTVPILVCFLMCFPVIYTNILEGFDNVPRELLEVVSIYTGKLIPRVRYVLMPESKPYIKAALSLGSGLAWKTVVAAEVLSSPKISMGYHLFLAKTYLEADNLFAWTVAIVILSVLFNKFLKFLLRFI